jgi:hypothetical protein
MVYRMNGEIGITHMLLGGTPEGKRPPERPRRRWVDNIKMNIGERVWDGTNWIGLAQDRVQWRAFVNAVMNLRVPKNAGKFLSGCTTGDLSRRVSSMELVIEPVSSKLCMQLTVTKPHLTYIIVS